MTNNNNAAIKAGELRLGNLVRWNPARNYPGTTLPPVVIEISAIWQDRVGFSSPNFDHRVEPFEDDRMQADAREKPVGELEGIPLEATLLEGSGFHRPGPGRFVCSFLELAQDPAQAAFLYHRSGGAPLALHYLHQLQNLYYVLTGDELDVHV